MNAGPGSGKTTVNQCVLCLGVFFGYGNNPWPLAETGRCCDDCNRRVVEARLAGLGRPL